MLLIRCLTTNSEANHLNFPIMNLNPEETLELQKKDVLILNIILENLVQKSKIIIRS